jgi:hypothetical protein
MSTNFSPSFQAGDTQSVTQRAVFQFHVQHLGGVVPQEDLGLADCKPQTLFSGDDPAPCGDKPGNQQKKYT